MKIEIPGSKILRFLDEPGSLNFYENGDPCRSHLWEFQFSLDTIRTRKIYFIVLSPRTPRARPITSRAVQYCGTVRFSTVLRAREDNLGTRIRRKCLGYNVTRYNQFTGA